MTEEGENMKNSFHSCHMECKPICEAKGSTNATLIPVELGRVVEHTKSGGFHVTGKI